MHPVNHIGLTLFCVRAIFKHHAGTVRTWHAARFAVEPHRLPGLYLHAVTPQLPCVLQRLTYQTRQLRLFTFADHDGGDVISSSAQLCKPVGQRLVTVAFVRNTDHFGLQPGCRLRAAGAGHTGGLQHGHGVTVRLTSCTVEKDQLCVLRPRFAQQNQRLL